MKQKFRILLCTLCVFAAVGMAVPPVHSAAVQLLAVPDSGITLDTPELTLELTQEAPAPVAYLCVYAPDDYFFVIWSSSDSRVASVDGTGKVTGHAGGKATITADTPTPSRQLKLTGGKGSLARVSQWVSSAPAVAVVSDKGVVTAKTSGRTVISALTSGGQVLRCVVRVCSEVGRVTVSKSAMLLPTIGGSQKLTAQAADQPEAKFTWVSSNPAVAQVSPDGTVTAVSDGETTIMAVSEQGRCGVCYVSVGAAAWRYRSEEELTEVLTLGGQLPYSDGK